MTAEMQEKGKASSRTRRPHADLWITNRSGQFAAVVKTNQNTSTLDMAWSDVPCLSSTHRKSDEWAGARLPPVQTSRWEDALHEKEYVQRQSPSWCKPARSAVGVGSTS